VGLVVEADFSGHVGQRLPGQDAVASGVEAPSDQIGMRWDSEDVGEGAGELGRSCSKLIGRCGQRDLIERVGIEERTELLGEVATRDLGRIGSRFS
jgi:hypothetical protein